MTAQDFQVSLKRRVWTFWRFLKYLGREFLDKNCQKNAAALTYMTLFALVPTITVTFTIFASVPAFSGVGDEVSNLIFAYVVPEAGDQIQSYLTDFSDQAKSLTLPGVAMLVITAYLMLTNIEKNFNAIWGVQQARRGLWSFLLYWAVLTIGPILLGAGLVMSTYLLSVKVMFGDLDIMTALTPLLRFTPLILASAAFTLLFAAVPNCRVPLREAVVGGVVTAIGFELAKLGFAAFVANSSFELIYGAFATVPIFLLWINVSWIIVLGGAVLVRTLAEKAYTRTVPIQADIIALLRCLNLFHDATKTGVQVSDDDCMSQGLGLVQWLQLRSRLTSAKWIVMTDSGRYVLAREMGHLRVWDAVRLVETPMGLEVDKQRLDTASLQSAIEGIDKINDQGAATLGMSLDEFFRANRAPSSPVVKLQGE